MKTALEKRNITSELKADIFHKIFLVNEFMKKGFHNATKYKSQKDILFITSIKNSNPEEIKNNLEKQLYSL